jgi:hypothetical protein
MSIWLLANTVGDNAAQIVATDTSDSSSGINQTGVASIKGGPRHLKWTASHATAARRLAYVNKSGGLVADFCVIVDAKAHDGKQVDIVEFTTYGTTESDVDSRTLADSDYVGTSGRDFVHQFSAKQSSKQGFAVEFAGTDYQKTARQIYFSEGLEFADMPDFATIQIERVGYHAEPVEHFGSFYHLEALASFKVSEVSRADLNTFLGLWKEDPVFFYDSSGSSQVGTAIEDKIWHSIIMNYRVLPVHDDSNEIEFDIGILRAWS